MSEIRTFFRYCPSCGRRFQISLVKKEVVKVDEEPEAREDILLPVTSQISGFSAPAPLVLEEGKTMMVEIDEYRYHYRCKHCGSEWTEKKVGEKPEPNARNPGQSP